MPNPQLKASMVVDDTKFSKVRIIGHNLTRAGYAAYPFCQLSMDAPWQCK